jgi:hypothetical protein
VTGPLRIANCSGFFGDRLAAAREMVDGGPIDVLTGDYLAELTMAILWRSRTKDPEAGYASTFLTQMEEVLATCLQRGIRVVSNAGGLQPRALAKRLEIMAATQGLAPVMGVVDGDDVLDRLEAFQQEGHDLAHMDTGLTLAEARVQPVTANAYLGGWGIARALELGCDVVVTGRVTDAALVIGPSAAHFGWDRHDWDRLAAALVAGHIIECGAQTTGGNYSFFQEVPGLDHVGFPLVEMYEDGTFVVTKHPGTGGLVSVGTVTAQLLYEIEGVRYRNPDVTARFDTIRLVQDGPDRVAVTGIEGEPPPPTTKLALNHLGGFKNSMTFVLTGLDVEEKAKAVEVALWAGLGGRQRFADTAVELIRSDRVDPDSNEQAMATLRVTVKDPDPRTVGRAFSRAAVELALAHYPGFFVTTPPGDASPYAVYWPALVPAELVEHRVTVGTHTELIPPVIESSVEMEIPEPEQVPLAGGEMVDVALGRLIGARSGDKGGNANVGVWIESDEGFSWLAGFLDVERFKSLLPETRRLPVDRYVFPNLRALNFVVRGLLGEGVSSSTRMDPQAKSLGEYLRAKLVQAPRAYLRDPDGRPTI